jgi:hypothetical protein
MCADVDLTLQGVRFLQSPRAQAELQELAGTTITPQGHLAAVMKLRERFTPQEAGWLLHQAALQAKAGDKFGTPQRCLLLEEALQQASTIALAGYHAQQFRQFHAIADLGCGIGGDLLAFAAIIPTVIAVEIDPIRAALARYNVINHGFGSNTQVLEGDWTKMTVDTQAAFIDPARRVSGRRVFSLQAMIPPIGIILRYLDQQPNAAVKTSPGVDTSEIPPTAEVEFISENGEMKEALLRFGALKQGYQRCATLLPSGQQLTETGMRDPDVVMGEARAYLYDPDPAVLRARLVRPLAARLGASMLDPEIAYLTMDQAVQTPLARHWKVIRQGPFNLKNLNRWLQEHNAGEVVIKKRGSAVDVDDFQRRLKTEEGGEKRTVFLTQCKGKPWMISTGDEIT